MKISDPETIKVSLYEPDFWELYALGAVINGGTHTCDTFPMILCGVVVDKAKFDEWKKKNENL